MSRRPHPRVSSWTKCIALAALTACHTLSRPLPEVAGPIADPEAYEAALRVELAEMSPGEETGLHNVYRLSDQVISGSEPHGDAAMQVLANMGVRTILSVDGSAPDAEMAARHGMAYVHVPIQYRGITADEMMRITKTFRDREGPFYVHCFHGKHRGPAAAAVGRLVLDGVSREQALAEMRQWCGTSASYAGLYDSIAHDAIPTPRQTDAYGFDFPAEHQLGGFRHAMIEMARAHDNLKVVEAQGWQTDPAHPDLDAVNEADLLLRAFLQGSEMEEVAARPDEFRQWLAESRQLSQELVDAIQGVRAGQGGVEAASQKFEQLRALCTQCHREYRNH